MDWYTAFIEQEQASRAGSLVSSEGIIERAMKRERAIANAATRYIAHPRAILNSQVPVNALPNELLAEIFVDVQREDLSLSCLQMTGVCRHWRALATATAALWTNIDLSWHPACVRHFFELSADMPVDVYSMSELEVDDVVEMISPYTHRIRGFVYGLGDEEADNVSEMITSLGSVLPNLQTLELDSPDDSLEPFGGHFPLLRSLKTTGFSFWFISGMLVNLVELEINEVPTRPEMMKLLQGLAACPCLERLSLSSSLPQQDMNAQASLVGPVSLPRLKLFDIFDDVMYIARFCAYLALPAGTCVSLHCRAFRYLATTNRLELEPHHIVVPRYDHSKWPVYSKVQSIRLSATSKDDWTQLHAYPDPDLRGYPSILMHFPHETHKTMAHCFVDVLNQCGDVFSASPVVRFVVVGEPDDRTWCYGDEPEVLLSANVWRMALLCLPRLEHLEVRGRDDVELLFEALGPFPTADAEIICPHLKTLSVGVCSRQRARKMLQDALGFRASRGSRLGTLTLPLHTGAWNGRSRYLEAFSPLVDNLNVRPRE
ncbi:hypothetical protein SCP_0116020 [Sparassis crispa]|uniref:F-box domain-containing protein n=1 Tax=Sparassis crispa TaxID=139825 RepID=A0A401G970_9APHY|nr:hypothetical protein SCP_0116020 [Sparassis crispa]GBE78711.1 hypothetical protein SCP_0116020 [Sparassis crispa]